ncbi:hypothetical protein [Alphaentomopoxvirus acuprea]|uniref:Entry-fusion complex protein OPG086 n=1 Tax=Alphaentomopoxvirus acuprea TaxID=62099 RepID=W6JL61_9POXV|nr:hypothetical protein BA82_gp225 [Anomala cuprea entomopoxvirus]BAO49585.1 hypothetical protein [Anomala cuprea entomopoxvirus]
MISLILNTIIGLFFLASLILIYFPLSIYELMSYTTTFDPIKEINIRYNDTNMKSLILFLSQNSINKQQGIIMLDLNTNNISFRVSGNTYNFDIDKDLSTYIPTYILALKNNE